MTVEKGSKIATPQQVQQGSYSSTNVAQSGISILDLIVILVVNVALKAFVQFNNTHTPPMSLTFHILRTME